KNSIKQDFEPQHLTRMIEKLQKIQKNYDEVFVIDTILDAQPKIEILPSVSDSKQKEEILPPIENSIQKVEILSPASVSELKSASALVSELKSASSSLSELTSASELASALDKAMNSNQQIDTEIEKTHSYIVEDFQFDEFKVELMPTLDTTTS